MRTGCRAVSARERVKCIQPRLTSRAGETVSRGAGITETRSRWVVVFLFRFFANFGASEITATVREITHRRDVQHLPLASVLGLLIREENEGEDGRDDVNPLEGQREGADGHHILLRRARKRVAAAAGRMVLREKADRLTGHPPTILSAQKTKKENQQSKKNQKDLDRFAKWEGGRTRRTNPLRRPRL